MNAHTVSHASEDTNPRRARAKVLKSRNGRGIAESPPRRAHARHIRQPTPRTRARNTLPNIHRARAPYASSRARHIDRARRRVTTRGIFRGAERWRARPTPRHRHPRARTRRETRRDAPNACSCLNANFWLIVASSRVAHCRDVARRLERQTSCHIDRSDARTRSILCRFQTFFETCDISID